MLIINFFFSCLNLVFLYIVKFDGSTSIGASYLRKLKLQFGRVVILNCCLGDF